MLLFARCYKHSRSKEDNAFLECSMQVVKMKGIQSLKICCFSHSMNIVFTFLTCSLLITVIPLNFPKTQGISGVVEQPKSCEEVEFSMEVVC